MNEIIKCCIIHEDNESFAEMIIFLMFYEIWKTWSLTLDEETD